MRPARLTVPALLAAVLVAAGTTTATAAPAPRAAVAATTATPAKPAPSAAAAVSTGRIFGANRYSTSAAISRANFKAPQDVVVVASGQTFPDALGAGPFAALLQAPLLLVPGSGRLPTEIATELDRLGTQQVVVAGGPGSVSLDMVEQLERHTKLGISYQVAGEDRYDTAAQLTDFFDRTGMTVYLASGTTFPDALGGGAAAGVAGGYLLLTGGTKLPAPTAAALKRLKPSRVVVLGGTGAISTAVLGAARSAAGPQATVTRVGGKDRFATAALVSAGNLVSASEVLLADGLSYPDALSGAAVARYAGGRPVLLTLKNCVPATTLAEVTRLRAAKVTALGGTGVVSDRALALTPC